MPAKAPKNAFATVLTAGLGPLLSSGKYSDLTVHCEDNAWKVHKMVMCTHSKFFVKACDGKFMEAKSGEIILAGDEPLVVEAMHQAPCMKETTSESRRKKNSLRIRWFFTRRSTQLERNTTSLRSRIWRKPRPRTS